MTLIQFGGFVFPLEWAIAISATVTVLLALVFILIVLIFRRKNVSPIEEDMAIIIPEDQHGTVQPGQLIGNVNRTETELIVENPDWQDDEGNVYEGRIPIEKVVPLPFFDTQKALKRLWLIRDIGDLVAVSITDLLHGMPRRWDPPLADRRKSFRFLVSAHGASSLTNLVGSKGGILLIGTSAMLGMLISFTIVVLSGHLR